MLRNIIFDMHGVFLPLNDETCFIAAFRNMCSNLLASKMNISLEEAEKIFLDGIKKFGSASAFMDSKGYYAEYLDSFYKIPYIEKKQPEIKGLLYKLKEAGAKLHIATNNPRKFALEQLRKIDIPPELFDKIVTASDAKYRPNPDQFEAIVGDNNKENYVFLGDRIKNDIIPARKFGIKAILTKGPEDTIEILQSLLWQFELASCLNQDYSVDIPRLFRGKFNKHIADILLNHSLGENILGRSPLKIEREAHGLLYSQTAEKVYNIGENIFRMYITFYRAGIPLTPAMLRQAGIVHRTWSDNEAKWLTDSILKSLNERKIREYFSKVLYSFYPKKSRMESTRIMYLLEQNNFFDKPSEDKIEWWGEVTIILKRALYTWNNT